MILYGIITKELIFHEIKIDKAANLVIEFWVN